MKRLISFLYDPLAGRYRFFGCLQHTTGVVCGEILKHLLIAESAPHYFEIWVGGKEPQFKLNKHTNVKYDPISVYHGGMNQLFYKKVETATWVLNGVTVYLTAELQEIVLKAIGADATALEFDVYTYGIDA